MKIIEPYICLLGLLLLPSCSSEFEDRDLVSDREIELAANVESSVSTRATLITTASIKDDATRFHIEAYKTGTTTQYLSSNAIYESGWKFFKNGVKGYKYYWPAYNLDFFAYSPYSLDKTKVTMNSYAVGAPTFTYTNTDTEISETTQSDATQTEFAYAFESNCAYADNAQTLTFHHPFALVDFQLDKAIRCTIKSIKITSIKNNGSFTYSTASPYATWTPSGENNTSIVLDYSAKYEYSSNGGIRYPEDVNGEGHLGGPFIVVPQDLADGSLVEVTYKALGATNYITVQSTLNKLSATSWAPGNKYIYSLTLNGAANELFVAVTVTPWTVEGNTETEVQ